MTSPSRSARRHLAIGVVCGLLVLLGLSALGWGRLHQYRQSSVAVAAIPPATQDAGVPAPRPSAATTRGSESAALPASVLIPRLGLSEGLMSLGLDAAGAVQVPSGAQVGRVAWFNGSPRPGDPGPAVIEGHVITPAGDGPFRTLATLRAGDRVVVRDVSGRDHAFTVYRLAQYAKNDFPTTEVYANTPGPELRLITCSGVFDTRTGHYDSNTVVYAR